MSFHTMTRKFMIKSSKFWNIISQTFFSADHDGENGTKIENRVRELCQKLSFLNDTPGI